MTDSATVLQIREALDLVEADIDAIADALAQPRAPIPRYADGRAQQSAAGRADHLRLQDGDRARRVRAPQAAPQGAARARAGRRIRRRRRHARVARRPRPRSAGRVDAKELGLGAAGDRLAHGARPHRRGRLLPRPRHRHLRQDRLRREADDADRGRGGVRAVPPRPRLVAHHAAEAQPDLVGLHHRAHLGGAPARRRAARRHGRGPRARDRPVGDRVDRAAGNLLPHRRRAWRRRASSSRACRSTRRGCAPISTSRAG